MITNLPEQIGGVETRDPSKEVTADELGAIAGDLFSGFYIADDVTPLYIGTRKEPGKKTTTTAGNVFLRTDTEPLVLIGEKDGVDKPELEGAISLIVRSALNAGRKAIKSKWLGETKTVITPTDSFNMRLDGLTSATIFSSRLVQVDGEGIEDISGWMEEAKSYASSLVESESENAMNIDKEYTRYVARVVQRLATIASLET